MTEKDFDNKKTKFILRKNATFYDSGNHSVLSPIQIINVFYNFEEAKREFYKQIMLNSKLYNDNGDRILGQSQRDIYKRMMFKNVYKEKKQLDEIIIKQKNSLFNSDLEIWTKIESINDAEFFNLLSPLNIFEIITTTNDYLYIPTFNSEFFEKTNKTIPFELKGLYIDELDFWTSQDYVESSGLSRFYSNDINTNNIEIIDITDDVWNNYNFTINNGLLALKEISPFSIFQLNNNLKIPFVSFNKISLEIEKIKNYEKQVNKKQVINIMLSEYYFDIDYFDDFINDERNIDHICFLTSLTPDFVKEIIIENKDEIKKRIIDMR